MATASNVPDHLLAEPRRTSCAGSYHDVQYHPEHGVIVQASGQEFLGNTCPRIPGSQFGPMVQKARQQAPSTNTKGFYARVPRASLISLFTRFGLVDHVNGTFGPLRFEQTTLVLAPSHPRLQSKSIHALPAQMPALDGPNKALMVQHSVSKRMVVTLEPQYINRFDEVSLNDLAAFHGSLVAYEHLGRWLDPNGNTIKDLTLIAQIESTISAQDYEKTYARLNRETLVRYALDCQAQVDVLLEGLMVMPAQTDHPNLLVQALNADGDMALFSISLTHLFASADAHLDVNTAALTRGQIIAHHNNQDWVDATGRRIENAQLIQAIESMPTDTELDRALGQNTVSVRPKP